MPTSTATRASHIETEHPRVRELETENAALRERMELLRAEILALRQREVVLQERQAPEPDSGILFPLTLPDEVMVQEVDLDHIGQYGLTSWRTHIHPYPLPIEKDGRIQTLFGSMIHTILIDLERQLQGPVEGATFTESCGRVACLEATRGPHTMQHGLGGFRPPETGRFVHLFFELDPDATRMLRQMYWRLAGNYWAGDFAKLMAGGMHQYGTGVQWDHLETLAHALALGRLTHAEFLFLLTHLRDFKGMLDFALAAFLKGNWHG